MMMYLIVTLIFELPLKLTIIKKQNLNHKFNPNKNNTFVSIVKHYFTHNTKVTN